MSKIEYYNRVLPLLERFIPLIGNKKEVKIADIGSGPYPTTGQLLNGIKVELYNSDNRNFQNLWNKNKIIPLFPIEIQDMEKLTYESNFFDIVYSNNALDHTINAEVAVKEMIRVCKPDGWVYIRCSLNQHTVRRKKHYWDAKEDGIFINETGKFNLKDHGFNIKYLDKGGKLEYNQIIATLKK